MKSLCHRYLKYSFLEFRKQDEKFVDCIVDTITNKMFWYEPYALADNVVKDYAHEHRTK